MVTTDQLCEHRASLLVKHWAKQTFAKCASTVVCECIVTEEFWRRAGQWFINTIQVNPPLVLKVLKLFGQEKEKPSDLLNIFYRFVRYRTGSTAQDPALKLLKNYLLMNLIASTRVRDWKSTWTTPLSAWEKGWDQIRKTFLHKFNLTFWTSQPLYACNPFRDVFPDNEPRN